MRRLAWASGSWTVPPVSAVEDGTDLVVEAAEGSDLWRTTSYDFVHESGHGLLAPLAPGSAVEVDLVLALAGQFDQAGLLVRQDERRWIKAGVELSDGVAQLGAVVTRDVSDWSVAPVPSWAGRRVGIRASRSGDALTVRARVDDEDWRLVRLAPLDPDAEVAAGPYCAAPSRAGYVVRFTRWAVGEADLALHDEAPA